MKNKDLPQEFHGTRMFNALASLNTRIYKDVVTETMAFEQKLTESFT